VFNPLKKYLIVLFLLVLLLLVSCSPQQEDLSANPTQTLAMEPPTSTSNPTATPKSTNTPTQPPPTETAVPSVTPTSAPTQIPSPTPLPTQISDKKGIPMVLVPAGSFNMGSTGLSANEEPVHNVYLDAFYIDQFEVSFEMYARFLNEMGNQFEGLANWIEAKDRDLHVHLVDGAWQVDPGFENYPMNEMTWYGARAFCVWKGGRLPTEAEWEKAARGTDERLYPWNGEVTCENANYFGCNRQAVPIDSYPQSLSPYGAYNMSGNIMEWVNDWYAPDYYANSPAENPTGPESGTHRVFRGGSWINGAYHIRTTYRWPKLPVLTYVATGFRCARDVIVPSP
jgi:formylglycine-generating enzyme required for sulfatase activity